MNQTFPHYIYCPHCGESLNRGIAGIVHRVHCDICGADHYFEIDRQGQIVIFSVVDDDCLDPDEDDEDLYEDDLWDEADNWNEDDDNPEDGEYLARFLRSHR